MQKNCIDYFRRSKTSIKMNNNNPSSLIGQNVLITTSQWFYGPDGKSYRAVWGKLIDVYESKNVFGFTPNRNHTNWMLQVGNMVIMGCQVMYCIKTDTRPSELVNDFSTEGGKVTEFIRPTFIYIAE
jgi:hypothetical protein